MQSHIIFNKYISDTNPLRLGYFEVWGVGSDSISSVSISVRHLESQALPQTYRIKAFLQVICINSKV